MDLQEFTTRALVQLAAAVKGAQAEVAQRGLNARINPEGRTWRLIDVEFDVAVTAAETTAGGGGGGVRVLGVLSADAKVSSETRAESVTRIRFKIPVEFPYTGEC